MATIYALILYPKNLSTAHASDFRIYSKQTSNLDIMQKYYAEHPSTEIYHTALVTREVAKQMKKTWVRHFYPFMDREIQEAKARMEHKKRQRRSRYANI